MAPMPSPEVRALGTGDAGLETLIQRYCGRFGEQVCTAVAQEAAEPNGLSRLLRQFQIKSIEVREAQLAALADWLDSNGTRAFFRLLAVKKKGIDDYSLKPVLSGAPQQHDRRTVELMVREYNSVRGTKTTKDKPKVVPFFGAGKGQTHTTESTTTAAGGAAARKPKSLVTGVRLRGEKGNSSAGAGTQSPPHNPSGKPAYEGPPGYPFPWPRHLKPGPVPPPTDLPPDKLTWPYIDRRTGADRRTGKERRNRLDVVYKNKRFGGERRKGDRRKNKQ